MNKKYLLTTFFILIVNFLNAQIKLSVYSEVSIITVGPGNSNDDLYKAFGHSAIRIKDPVLNLDLIYNYGVFDFNQPNFYTNFAKGKMIYTLARYNFIYFLEDYKQQKRWVKQQTLNLTQTEKQAFFVFLENNAKPNNANYLYDPYFNNCATILRDITNNLLGNKVTFINNIAHKKTIRSLMNNKIYWNSWGSLGINLITGTILDKKATFTEYMFLPEFLYQAFKNATIYKKNQPVKLVKKEKILLKESNLKSNSTSLLNPFFIFCLVLIFVTFVTYHDYKKNKRTKIIDFLILFLTGLIGTILLYFWFFSNHSTAPNNYNILWAFAPNVFISFLFLKNKLPKWVFKYVGLQLILLVGYILIWIFKIQLFPLALLPLLVLFLIRYLYLLKFNSFKKYMHS